MWQSLETSQTKDRPRPILGRLTVCPTAASKWVSRHSKQNKITFMVISNTQQFFVYVSVMRSGLIMMGMRPAPSRRRGACHSCLWCQDRGAARLKSTDLNPSVTQELEQASAWTCCCPLTQGNMTCLKICTVYTKGHLHILKQNTDTCVWYD